MQKEHFPEVSLQFEPEKTKKANRRFYHSVVSCLSIGSLSTATTVVGGSEHRRGSTSVELENTTLFQSKLNKLTQEFSFASKFCLTVQIQYFKFQFLLFLDDRGLSSFWNKIDKKVLPRRPQFFESWKPFNSSNRFRELTFQSWIHAGETWRKACFFRANWTNILRKLVWPLNSP